MITVALPTWNNKRILWLPMEGLCRQQTTIPWELIVMECASKNEATEAFFRAYEPRLKKAGCVSINYIYSPERLPLSQKWRRMASEAKGKFFCLQASDDYPHPTRNQDAWNANADWFDCNRYFHYDVIGHRMIIYNGGQSNDTPRELWRTGFNMVIRTRLLRHLPDEDIFSSVDGWLLRSSNPKNRFVDDRLLPGVSTNGMNTISEKRIRFYVSPTPPFYKTESTLKTIGIPPDIAERLTSIIRNTGGYEARKLHLLNIRSHGPSKSDRLHKI